MSRGRLSDCSGSTTGKMEVRVLTHSQAVSSACERRESIACARKGSLRLLLCPGVRARAREKKKKTREARARGVIASSSVAVRTETVHGLRNDRGMPVFTPGSNPRRLPAAASRRESRFLSSSRRDGSRRRGARRGAAARTRTHLFLRGRVPRERAGASRSRRSFGICSSEKTVRRRRSDARAEPKKRKNEKKNAPRASTTTAPSASRVRRGQDRNES